MYEIRYTEAFIEDAASVSLESKRHEIRRRVEQLASFPEMGSANLPESIRARYGSDVRKLVVNPFLVIYEVSDDAVEMLGIVHQRAAW